ncbi:DUF2141 domain-containing protein [Roseospira goensis]|uniref:Uncharacterized protein (DUF2141 family) n=1 Tax=Roseospira goensis TaxID=391922 RepID=A0A7W6S0U5_9PROT|nr:uncharacterized protein (DUF2141 family) [Roseospira goensis]
MPVLLALMAVLPTLAGAEPGPAPTATLALTITDLAESGGTVYVAVYDDPAAFLDADAKRAGTKATVRGDRVTVRIPDLAPGRYAVAAYHDQNDNGRFDTGLFGIPLEGFGFTRDPSVVPARPTFADAAVTVTAPETRHTFRMRYAL